MCNLGGSLARHCRMVAMNRQYNVLCQKFLCYVTSATIVLCMYTFQSAKHTDTSDSPG